MLIRFSEAGAADVEHDLLNFERRLAEPRVALLAVAELMRAAMALRFDEQPWEPLAESTVASKSAMGLDPRILHATLALRDSLTKPAAAGMVEVVSDRSLHFGTSIDYAIWHDRGTSRMPQRKIIDFSQANLRAFSKEIQRYAVHGETGLVPGLPT